VVDSLGPYLGLWPSFLDDDIYQVAFVFTALGLAVGVYASFVVSSLLFVCHSFC
jgi:ethanolaminephosphotransferase